MGFAGARRAQDARGPRSSPVPRLAALLLAALACAARPALAWRTSLDGVGAATADFWNAVAHDSSGDLFVAGVSIYPDESFGCGNVVARLDGTTGEVLWRTSVADDCYDETVARSADEQLLVDPVGDVVVGRRGLGHDRSFVVYKYAGGNGEVLWSVRVGAYGKHGPFVHSTALDLEGNVIVGAGLLATAGRCGTDLVVAKLAAATGAEVWRKTLRGSFEPDSSCEDDAFNRAVAVAADGDGDVLAVGTLVDTQEPAEGGSPRSHPLPAPRGVALKLSAEDGSEAWRADTPVAPWWVGAGTTLVVGSDGDFAHVGNGFQVIKRSGVDGAELWTYTRAAATPYDAAFLLDLGDDGDFAVGGPVEIGEGAGPVGVAVAKLDGSTGAERWSATVNGSFGRSDAPSGLAIDAAGNVVVSADVQSAESGLDWLVTKLAAADGSALWRLELDGASDDPPLDWYPDRSDDAGAVAVRGEQVAAVGSLIDPMTGQDGVALLLSGSGDEVWREVSSEHQIARDRALAVAVAPNGDAIAAGTMEGETVGEHFAVHRLAGATGELVWSRDLGEGDASAVAVDPAGDLLAAGRLWQAGRAFPGRMVTVKLAGGDGGEAWRAVLGNHDLPNDGAAVPFGLTPEGDVIVAAIRRRKTGSFDSFVWRLAHDSGARLWRKGIAGFAVHALAVDAPGNVVVYGGGSDSYSSSVVKLDGATGARLWRRTVPIAPYAALAASPAGEVVLAGQIVALPNLLVTGVLQLHGATGAEAWRNYLGLGRDAKVAVTPGGDVLAAMNVYESLPPDNRVLLEVVAARIVGATGVRAWMRTVKEPGLADRGVTALASDPAGDAMLGGCGESGYEVLGTFAVTKLAGANGDILWRRTIASAGDEMVDWPRPVAAFAFDTMGNVVAAGATDDRGRRSDFTVVKWDSASASDLVAPADRRCRDAIAAAGKTYLLDRLDVLQTCRDNINRGRLALAPSGCPENAATRRALDRAGRRTRSSIERACGATLPADVSCAATLDALVNGDARAGCLIESHDAADDQALGAEYGPPLDGTSPAAISCQAAIGDAGRRFLRAAMNALQGCRPSVGSVEVCRRDERVSSTVRDAALRARKRIAGACAAPTLATVTPCATTLSGLVAGSGEAGCLVETHRAAAEAAVEAEY